MVPPTTDPFRRLWLPWKKSCGRPWQLYHIPHPGWLGSRVVSVLDTGAEGSGFKSQPRRCRVTVLGKLFTPVRRASVHHAAKLVAADFRVARVTAGLAVSNDNLPPGLWLASPTGWLPRTGIISGTLRSYNWVWATFTFHHTRRLHCCFVESQLRVSVNAAVSNPWYPLRVTCVVRIIASSIADLP